MTFVDPNQQAPSVENIARILQERRSRYGDFSNNADAAVDLKNTFKHYIRINAQLNPPDASCQIPNYMREALDLIATKLSRILTGDPFYVDNWDDIAGYAKLVADRVRAKQALTSVADDFPLSPPAESATTGCIDTATLTARVSSMADISLMRDLDADQKQVLSWHPSHSVCVMQDLGGDIYSQCLVCKTRELQPEAEMPCVAPSTETELATSGADER